MLVPFLVGLGLVGLSLVGLGLVGLGLIPVLGLGLRPRPRPLLVVSALASASASTFVSACFWRARRWLVPSWWLSRAWLAGSALLADPSLSALSLGAPRRHFFGSGASQAAELSLLGFPGGAGVACTTMPGAARAGVPLAGSPARAAASRSRRAAGARARSPASDGESSGVEKYTRSFRGIVPAARELPVRRIL